MIVLAGSFFLVGDGWTNEAQVAVAPSPGVSAQPSASPSPERDVLTQSERKALLKEFQKAQSGEYKATEHRLKFELRELKAAQNARLKQWLSDEEDKRHHYFEAHSAGAEKRAYIQDFLSRRKALDAVLKDEWTVRNHEADVRLKSVKDDQSTRMKEFLEVLGKGLRPSKALWPGSGR
ncbi:MAG: hypothetical protein ACXVCH_05440 [Bdellovibrionota bacterium]